MCGRDTASRAAPLIWVGLLGESRTLRVYAGFAAGRHLYMRLPTGDYLYAGHSHRRCPNCEVVAVASERCQLCGETLVGLHADSA